MSVRQLYIKRVDANHAPLIEHIFRENYGELTSIEIIRHSSQSKKNKYSARLFVEYWYSTQVSINFVDRLTRKGSAKVVYNDPHAWVVVPDREATNALTIEALNLHVKELNYECERLRGVARNFHHDLLGYQKQYYDLYDLYVTLKAKHEKPVFDLTDDDDV